MRALVLLAVLALAGCDFVPTLSGNRSDVPEAGSGDATPTPEPTPSAVAAAPAPAVTPADNASVSPVAATAPADDVDATAGGPSASTFAPSFTCRGTMGRVETLICNDARLAQLDRRLTRAYANARVGADVTMRANLLEGQRQFLAQRNACEDGGCVLDAYRDRIDELERTAAPDNTCRAEIGAAAAARLARQCMEVSPATHPPCNVENSCALMQNEVDRSCAMFRPGDDIPGFCRQ